ncbi:hypothetical protein C8R48DRAFT_710282 [Suillus tomentosus]|nr:hypothetical protein C8R48DRAFT_710282 [Suillus tomentosus]
MSPETPRRNLPGRLHPEAPRWSRYPIHQCPTQDSADSSTAPAAQHYLPSGSETPRHPHPP